MSLTASLIASRTLARSVWRGTSVHPCALVRSVASASRVALVHRAPRQVVAHSAARSFASDSNAAQELMSLLRREYDEETEHDSTLMPSDLQDLQSDLEKAGWKVASDGATTKLIRTLDDGSKVQISFHVQDNILDESRLMEQGEDDEEELAARVRFTCVVTKAGKHMVFICISEDAQVTIENVAISTSGASVDEILKDGSVDEQQYQGPEFIELAEDLQDAFHAYLQDHVGINENTASFISMYADYQEQVEYVNFLQEAQNILK